MAEAPQRRATSAAGLALRGSPGMRVAVRSAVRAARLAPAGTRPPTLWRRGEGP